MEQKKMAEAQKGIRKYERRIKELTYQVRQQRVQLGPRGPLGPASPLSLPLTLAKTPSPAPGLGAGACRARGQASSSIPPVLCPSPSVAPPWLRVGHKGLSPHGTGLVAAKGPGTSGTAGTGAAAA